jgi:hypothetical protein
MQENNNNCGICRGPIVHITGINYKKCCGSYMKLIYVFFMLTVGSALTMIHGLGTCIMDDKVTSNRFLAGCFTVPFMMMFWQGRLWNCCMDRTWIKCCNYNIFCGDMLRYKLDIGTTWTCIVVFFFSNFLVMLAHFIGSIVILVNDGNSEIYTCRTSINGYMMYGIFLGFYLIFSIMMCTMRFMIQDIKNRYGYSDYGVKVMDENTRLV